MSTSLTRFPIPPGEVRRLRASLRAPLGSGRLPAQPMGLGLEHEQGLDIGGDGNGSGIGLGVRLAGELAISLFNDPTDEDADGILGRAGEDDGDDALPPLLPPAQDRACLKYVLGGGLTAMADAGPDEGGGLGFEAGGQLRLIDYRVHPRTAAIGETLAGDLGGRPRFVLDLDHVRSLAVGEALAMDMEGQVSLAVEVRWSDVLAFGVGGLAGVLGGGALALEVDAAASVRAQVRLGDRFLLVVARRPEGYRIALRKASLRGSTVAPALGVHVSLARSEVATFVEALAARATGNLRGQLASGRDALVERLVDLARAKVSAGFSYEYARLRLRSDVLALTSSEAWLATHHADLVRGRLDAALESLRRGEAGARLERFLDRRSLRVEHSWGFTLGMDRWWAAAGRDRTAFETVTRTLLDGRQTRGYVALRAYDGSLGGSTTRWSADLRAETPSFSEGRVPRLDEYELGLSLTWSSKEGTVAPDELAVALDAAVLWNAVPQDDARVLERDLSRRVGRSGEMVVQLVLDHPCTLAVLAHAVRGTPAALAGPLAAAMPHWELSDPRQTVYRRRQLYTPLWKRYLEDSDGSAETWARTAERHLEAEEPGLARLEARHDAAPPYTFAGLIALNDTAAACARFHGTLARLHQGIAGRVPDDGVLPDVLEQLRKFFAQSHHTRAAGVYFLDAARVASALRRVRRSITIRSEGLPTVVLGAG